jgi:hypothetical protein
MRFRGITRAHKVFGAFRNLATTLSAACGASLKADPSKISGKFGDGAATIVQFAQTWAWLAVPGLLLLAAAFGWARATIGDPRIWRVVHDTLDQFREKLFQHTPDDQMHEHRVTLFQRVPWCWCFRRWPWDGWLIPVERSGHTTQRSGSIFKAPDNADHVEGVAGMTWSRRKPVYVPNLPDLTPSATDAEIQDYARNSWVSEEYVRKQRPRFRSLYGIPVEVKGQIWGVFVVDSRHPIIREKEVKQYYKMIARFLGKTLEAT